MKIKFIFPYDTRLSKNKQHDYTGQSGNKWDAFITPEGFIEKRRPVVNAATATKLMGDVARMARGEVNRHKLLFKPVKTWVNIMVFRPDLKADPVNFLDMIVDGIKVGIGIDDNLYSGSWDWKLVDESEKRIEIEVSQREESKITGGGMMQDRMVIAFDPYQHKAEILFVGEQDECEVEAKNWWENILCSDIAWDKLEWREENGSQIQDTYDPKVVICGSTIPCERFHESGLCLGILPN